MNSPLVSIITAAYNSDPEHLYAALSSALQQTHQNLEIIVSDDSRDDALASVVEALRDTRLHYRRNEPALGVARNHWQCLREVRGEFVVVLNHDDMLEPQFVQRLLEPLQLDAAVSVAFCDHWIIDAKGKRNVAETDSASHRYGRKTLAPGLHRPFFQLLVRQTIPMVMGAMFRRTQLPATLPPDAGPAYDCWLTYLLCRDGLGAWYVPERLSSWRSHAANLTSAGDLALLIGAARCWSAVTRDPNAMAIRRMARIKEATAYCACSRWCSRRGRRRESREFAWRAFSAHAHWRALTLYVVGALPAAIGRRLG